VLHDGGFIVAGMGQLSTHKILACLKIFFLSKNFRYKIYG